MDEDGRVKRGLLQLIQSGAYRDIFGFKEGDCGIVEFVLQRIYRIRLAPRRIMLYEHEEELVRRRLGKRWKAYRPITLDRGCVVIGRKSGEILASPSLGKRMKTSCAWAGAAGPPKWKDDSDTTQRRGQ